MTDSNPPPSTDPLSTIPPLTTLPATSDADRTAALHLIADSVAQQRQIAAKAIIFHPLTLASLIAILGITYKLLYRESGDVAIVFTTFVGCVMAGLVGLRGLTSGYLDLAERTGTWAWLASGRDPNNDGQDVVLVTKYGDEVIGALVLRPVARNSISTRISALDAEALKRKTKTTGGGPGGGKKYIGLIRAWTVVRRYRRQSIGTGLLEEAVSMCRANRWEGPVFDREHANSARLVPRMFDVGVERAEGWARRTLEKVEREQGKRRKA